MYVDVRHVPSRFDEVLLRLEPYTSDCFIVRAVSPLNVNSKGYAVYIDLGIPGSDEDGIYVVAHLMGAMHDLRATVSRIGGLEAEVLTKFEVSFDVFANLLAGSV